MLERLLLASLLPATSLVAQTPLTVALEDFSTGLVAPVDIAHCGDDRLFVVEQAGRIMIVAPDGTVSGTPFLDIRARVNDSASEQGLLGLAFDPDYADNGRFYVNYIYGSGNGATRVSRFTVSEDPDVADADSEEVIYSVQQPYRNHNGGDLDFGPDGHLYVPFGDGGDRNDPLNSGQDLVASVLGDIIRIDVRGEAGYTIPTDNPWVDSGNDTLPEIWASGLRNPWRFGFDAETGDLWLGDVGQGQREEIDFWPAGDNSGPNFGWRCYEGDIATPGINDDCPPASAFVAPVSVHTSVSGWRSIIGGRVYRGGEYPRLYGRYIYTDHFPTPYFSLRPDGSGGWIREQLRADNGGMGSTCIAENSALELFVANGLAGTIKRIVDQCPMPAPVVSFSGEQLSSTEADSYAWYFEGELIPGEEGRSLTPQQDGTYHVVAGFGGVCELASEPVQVLNTGLPGVSLPGLSVMPVPANDILVLTGVTANVASVDVLDMTGRAVASKAWNNASAGTVDVASLANAMYILRLVDHSGATLGQRTVQVQH